MVPFLAHPVLLLSRRLSLFSFWASRQFAYSYVSLQKLVNALFDDLFYYY